jgi:hypothetical protein
MYLSPRQFWLMMMENEMIASGDIISQAGAA